MEKAAYSVAMQPCSYTGGNTVATNNISILVNKYRRLRRLLVPFYDLFEIVSYIRRWQSFLHSSCAVTVLTLLSLNLSKGYRLCPRSNSAPADHSFIPFLTGVFLAFVTLLFCVAMAIGYYHHHTGSAFARRLQALPHVSYINQDQAHLEELQKEEKANEDDLLEFQYLFKKSQEVITLLCGTLDHLYGIVLWRLQVESICVSLLLSIALLVIYTNMLHIVFGCWPIMVFCLNAQFVHSVFETYTQCKKALENRKLNQASVQPTATASTRPTATAGPHPATSTTAATSPTRRATPTSPVVPVESSGDMSDGEDAQASVEGEQGSRGRPPGATTDLPKAASVLTAQDSEVTSASSLALVDGDEYLFVRQRSVDSQQEPGGTAAGLPNRKDKDVARDVCTRCKVSFSKLLKRRHDCNYCGQLFCGSCTTKVKKYLLGATSPAAYEESVRVCLDCNEKLVQERSRSRSQVSTL